MSLMPRNSAVPGRTTDHASTTEKSLFEQQRDELVGEIAVSLEHVLQNLNRLNRNLESVTAVGNEFSSVEALWSQFESVMAKDVDADADKDSDHGRDDGDVQANDPQDDSEAKNMPEEGATTVTTPKRGD